jgi:hypothetical protein
MGVRAAAPPTSTAVAVRFVDRIAHLSILLCDLRLLATLLQARRDRRALAMPLLPCRNRVLASPVIQGCRCRIPQLLLLLVAIFVDESVAVPHSRCHAGFDDSAPCQCRPVRRACNQNP